MKGELIEPHRGTGARRRRGPRRSDRRRHPGALRRRLRCSSSAGAEPSDASPGHRVSTRSMELLRSWGLEDEVRAGGVDVEWRMWQCRDAGRAPPPARRSTVGLPTREQSALDQPDARRPALPQDHLEPVLARPPARRSARARRARRRAGRRRRRARRRPSGAARRRRGRDRTRACALRSSPPTARTARSRERSASPMRGPSDGSSMRSPSLFRAPLWDAARRRAATASTRSTAPGGRGRRSSPAGRATAGSTAPCRPGDERGGPRARADHRADPARRRRRRPASRASSGIGAFSFVGPAGRALPRTAACSSSATPPTASRPRGGTGHEHRASTTATTSAGSSAWVLRGWARPELLDSYEAERRPVAEHNVARSRRPGRHMRDADDELHVDLGGRHPARVASRLRRPHVSTLDLLGPGLTLFTGPDARAWARGRRLHRAVAARRAHARRHHRAGARRRAAAARCSPGRTARRRAGGRRRTRAATRAHISIQEMCRWLLDTSPLVARRLRLRRAPRGLERLDRPPSGARSRAAPASRTWSPRSASRASAASRSRSVAAATASPGSRSCDGGILIDLGLMNGIRVDPDARTARAQAGCCSASSTARRRRSGSRSRPGSSRTPASPASRSAAASAGSCASTASRSTSCSSRRRS